MLNIFNKNSKFSVKKCFIVYFVPNYKIPFLYELFRAYRQFFFDYYFTVRAHFRCMEYGNIIQTLFTPFTSLVDCWYKIHECELEQVKNLRFVYDLMYDIENEENPYEN